MIVRMPREMTDVERECVNAWIWAAIWWFMTKRRLSAETAAILLKE